MIVILMGVAGSGKTTIGRLLAEALEWKFFDADDFHSQENVERMRQGIELTDKDREPWLDSLHELLRELTVGRNRQSSLSRHCARRTASGLQKESRGCNSST
jgi:gluconokinase